MNDKKQKIEQTWFDRDEHKAKRFCTCFCGNTFQSEARELPCFEREVKNKKGRPVLDESGKPTIKISVMRKLSKWPCPKCYKEHNWIQNFK